MTNQSTEQPGQQEAPELSTRVEDADKTEKLPTPKEDTDKTEKLPILRALAQALVPAATKDVAELEELEAALQTIEIDENTGEIPILFAKMRIAKKRVIKRPWYADSWMVTTMICSYIASIVAFYYFFETHQTVLYGDAYAHMLIIRRLFDSATPGLAQLGGVWLPLPHLVMWPFIWNDYLWRSGLAGTIPSMICYIVATHYLFLAIRRLTKDSRASFVGSLVFILNPNVLYLQTTALSEIVLIATLTAASYYFLVWTQEDRLPDLIRTAIATFLATLARYDGWFLFVAFLVLIIVVGLLKRQRRAHIEGNLILFGSLGGLGIVLWLLWCYLIFGDPLYFQRGPFSSQAMQMSLNTAHVLFTYHDLWQSLRYYTIDSILNLGWLLFILACVGLVVFVMRRRITAEVCASLVFLAPFAFYVISLYGGQGAIYVPGAVPPDFEHQIYNARYGVEVVAPAALFIALLASNLPYLLRNKGQLVLSVLIVAQSIWIAATGIISLEDGQFGLDCAHGHPIVIFLAQHYNGGRILEDLFDTKIDALNPEAGINFKDVVYEGSGQLWQTALQHPAKMVDWIITNQADAHDRVAQHLTTEFYTQFTRDIEEPNGLSVFHRNGMAMPTRPVPTYFLTQHALCKNASPQLGFSSIPTSQAAISERDRAWWQRRDSLSGSAQYTSGKNALSA